MSTATTWPDHNQWTTGVFIDKIVDQQHRGHGTQYWVRWQGEGPEGNKWLPARELEDCAALDEWQHCQRTLASTSQPRSRSLTLHTPSPLLLVAFPTGVLMHPSWAPLCPSLPFKKNNFHAWYFLFFVTPGRGVSTLHVWSALITPIIEPSCSSHIDCWTSFLFQPCWPLKHIHMLLDW